VLRTGAAAFAIAVNAKKETVEARYNILCERERERERGRGDVSFKNLSSIS